jgi:hypothetical protein
MRRLRPSLVLLTLCVGALLVSWLQLARNDARLPPGSSYSTQADGAQALYLWSEALGSPPRRVRQPVLDEHDLPRLLLVVQPEAVLGERDRKAFDAVAQNGGTLVLAGDSPPLLAYARELGVRVDAAQVSSSAITAEGTTLLVASRYRLRGVTGTPLLTAGNGDLLAARKPYLSGSLIVIASPAPLTNADLRDPDTARFVYRELLAPVAGQAIAFDEAHHTFVPPDASQPATVDGLLFETAPGRAVVYAALLTFAYLFLAGLRLGPPIPERGSGGIRRTMYEHVQMLAGLYRRAGQLSTVRSAFDRHYQRRLARGGIAAGQLGAFSEAADQVHAAQSEAALLAAVVAAERAASAR